MIQLLVIVMCVWLWVLPLPAWADGMQEEEAPAAEPLSKIIVPPGIPLTEAFEILKRHHGELMQLPGVTSVGMGADGIIVETTNPAVLPAEVEGILIKPVPPPAQGSAFSSEPDVGGTLPSFPQEQMGLPLEQRCGPYAHWEPAVGRCRRDAVPPDSPLPPPAHYLPPPPGVIILRPDGTHEQADACPAGFTEHVSLGDWRFCLPPGYAEPIPPLWAPPIAGIPYEEALKILERHQAELMQLPGAGTTGLGADGIEVETNNPAILPKEVEGLPIRPRPPRPKKFLSHTANTKVRPLHGGAVAIRDVLASSFGGTLTGVALSQGRPWLILPTPHNIRSGPLTKI